MTEIEVDARGLRCPMPVIRLAEAARDAAAGTVITILATDPAARHDIPAWCRMRDHELRALTEVTEVTEPDVTNGSLPLHPAYLRFVVALRPQLPKTPGAGTSRALWSRET